MENAKSQKHVDEKPRSRMSFVRKLLPRRGCVLRVLGVLLCLFLILWGMLHYANLPVQIFIPENKLPKPNGYDDLVKATKMLRDLKPGEGNGPSSVPDGQHNFTDKQLQDFLRINRPILDVCRRGLTKPFMQPSVRHISLGMDLLTDRFNLNAPVREIARRLTDEGDAYAHFGNYSKAVSSKLDACDHGVTYARGGVVIHFLVGYAVFDIGAINLEAYLQKLRPTELRLASIRLGEIKSKRYPIDKVFQEDGNSTLSMFVDMFKEISWSDATQIDIDQNSFSGYTTRIDFAFRNKRNVVRSIKDYYAQASKAQRSYYNSKQLVTFPRLGPFFSDCISKPELFRDCRVLYEGLNAELEILITETALLRYKAEHGLYPDTLSGLCPAYLKSIPIDPFNFGKPLKYKPLAGNRQYLLYSIGSNQKDDGGIWKKHGKADIVAGQLVH